MSPRNISRNNYNNNLRNCSFGYHGIVQMTVFETGFCAQLAKTYSRKLKLCRWVAEKIEQNVVSQVVVAEIVTAKNTIAQNAVAQIVVSQIVAAEIVATETFIYESCVCENCRCACSCGAYKPEVSIISICRWGSLITLCYSNKADIKRTNGTLILEYWVINVPLSDDVGNVKHYP